MIIKEIKLINFRNHEEFEMGFRKKTTVITGGNGWGKTSVLEAIYLACLGRSFRGVDEEMLRRGEEYYRVDCETSDGVRVVRYEREKRCFEVGGKLSIRLPRKSRLPVVLFLPSDLHLVESSPTRRRDYFDRVISGVDEGYHSALSRYSRALRQRNEMLKREDVTGQDVFAWNVMMARYGAVVAARRREVCGYINERLNEVYGRIATSGDSCELELRGVTVGEEGYLAEMERSFVRDKITGHTGYGVHRDEWVFRFNGEVAEGNASRGETRSMVLALKFIEAERIEEEMGRKPLVLLDDVLSELDEVRRERIVRNFGSNQVIMTSVG